MMDVFYSSSDSYAFLAGISILSLLENNKHIDRMHIYVMDNKISQDNRDKLSQIVESYEREITFVPMPDLQELTGRAIDTRRWNISTFGRLYMASALPKTVHKVLNIDCDTIIVDRLDKLWDIDIRDAVCGGMPECISDRYRQNIGMENGSNYINGGIIYLNLDEVRKGDYEKKFTKYIAKYGDSLPFLDQDVINSVVPQEKMKVLPIRYNMVSLYFYATYEQIKRIRRSNTFYSKSEFEEGKQNPAIVHFTTCFLDGLRPWIKGNRHPYLQEFLKYKEMSPWKDMPLQEDKRNSLIKFSSWLIRNAPKAPLCEIASFLHGVIRPQRYNRKMHALSNLNDT